MNESSKYAYVEHLELGLVVGVLLLLPSCQPQSPPYGTLHWPTAMLRSSSTEPTLTQPTVHFKERGALSALKIHMNKCTIIICLH